MINLETLATEQRNSHSQHIDSVSTEDMLRIINDEDHKVADAVGAIIPDIAKAVDTIADRLRRAAACSTWAPVRPAAWASSTPSNVRRHTAPTRRHPGLIAGGYEAISVPKKGGRLAGTGPSGPDSQKSDRRRRRRRLPVPRDGRRMSSAA